MKTPKADRKYSPSYGVVCLIDALGAKNFNDEENQRFIEAYQVIYQAVHEKVESELVRHSLSQAQVAVFNDTIIIAIECAANSETEANASEAMAYIVRKLIVDGIDKGIFFRGAIGIGKFIVEQDPNIIIGQAVTDAANWYEVPNFIGCVATPRFALTLRKHFPAVGAPSKWLYIPHSVQTKDGKKDMLCVNWPMVLFSDTIRPAECRANQEAQYLYRRFSDFFIPKSAEVKFENTLSFYDQSCNSLKVIA